VVFITQDTKHVLIKQKKPPFLREAQSNNKPTKPILVF